MKNALEIKIERFLLPYVEKPMRYVGGELNSVKKNLADTSLHGTFCFPDIYDIGMSHNGLQILYHIINKKKSWALSRAFTPWPDAEKILRENHLPLYSLEYFLPLNCSDWLGFSLQYELQYTNVVNMLDLGNVPVFARDRTDNCPLVIGGGPCLVNPEPLSDFFDAFVIGDGEEALVAFCSVLEKAKARKTSRQEILKQLQMIQGMYVPSLYPTQKNGMFIVPEISPNHRINPAKIEILAPENYPSKPLVPLIDVVHHRMGIEVMRGCTRGCRFCSAGMFYRPVRERSPEDINDSIETALKHSGWREIGLLSLSTADYSQLTLLLGAASKLQRLENIKVGIPSTRIDALTREQIDKLTAISHSSSYTIAPEAGTERLRRVINKGFSDDDILSMIKTLLQYKLRTIKLYFMIGLPTETESDIKGLIELLKLISSTVRSVSKACNVNVSLSPFSPKPGIPFQWVAMNQPLALHEKGKKIKAALKPYRNLKVSYRDARVTFLETILARGDRSFGPLIFDAWKRGARLDGWSDFFNLDVWKDAAREKKVDLELFTHAIPFEQQLPWDFLGSVVTKQFLQKEYKNAMEETITEDCRNGTCSGCEACTDPLAHINKLKQTELISHNENDEKQIDQGNRDNLGNRYYYRVVYRKKGGLIYLGHRAMVNAIERAFIACQVPVEYSNGFNPHPRMSFGPPLPMGVQGEQELFDIITRETFTTELTSINRLLPEGLELVKLSRHTQKPPSLNASITKGMYSIFRKGADSPQLPSIPMGFMKNPEIVVEYLKKGREVTRNIRPLIVALSQKNTEKGTFLEAELSMKPGQSCSPAMLLSALAPGKTVFDYVVTRENCLLV